MFSINSVSLFLTFCSISGEVQRLVLLKSDGGINDFLNENDERDVLKDDNNVTEHIADIFINKLRHLQEIHKLRNTMTSSEINPKMLNPIVNDESIIDYSNETSLSDNPFWVAKINRRVYHGQTTDIQNFPFMASIHVRNVFRCAGMAIKNDVIITSATCLQRIGTNTAILSVRVGSSYTDRDGEKISVESIHPYPYFEPATLKHNVGLIKLSHKTLMIRRVIIDTSATPMSDHPAKIFVIGWGIKTGHDSKLHRLSYSVLTVYPKRKCQKLYTKKHFSHHHFCASSSPKKGGACQHDIGGPGILGDNLIGIISYASSECGKTPTVFTKVGYYAGWIQGVLGKEAWYIFIPPLNLGIGTPVGTSSTIKISGLSSYLTDKKTQSGPEASWLRGAVDVFKGFFSNKFLRAQDDTASKEDISNAKNVIHILD